MDFIKEWTFCICITLIVSVIFSLFSPKGTTGRFYKIVISVFIFASFLYPLSEVKSTDFKIDMDFDKEYSQVTETSTEMEISGLIKETLSKNDVNSSNIIVRASEKDNEVNIDSVVVYVADKYEKENVYNIIFDNLGIVSDVRNIGD